MFIPIEFIYSWSMFPVCPCCSCERRHRTVLSLCLSFGPLAQRLTDEQRLARERGACRPSYTLTDDRHDPTLMPSFFLDRYRQWYGDLARRLRVDDTLLDYNYSRLFQCMDMMIRQRLQNRIPNQYVTTSEPLPVDEYAIALEFYLQLDRRSMLFIDHLISSLSSESLLHEDMFVSWRSTNDCHFYGSLLPRCAPSSLWLGSM